MGGCNILMVRWTALALVALGGVMSPLAAEPLQVAGRHDVMEIGPVLHAVRAAGPDLMVFASGGVDNLFKSDRAGAGAGGEFDHAAGRADVAAQAETQALRASLAHPDLRIVLTIAEGLYNVVARRSAGIDGPSDLRGKRVGVFERTSAAYFLHRLLEKAGLTEADITVVALRPREMASALAERRVDAVAIWEPESERSRAALGVDAMVFGDPSVYRELYNINVTAAALEDPAARKRIVDFVRRLIGSARVAREKPEAIWPLVAESSGYDAALVAASWKHHRFPAAIPPDMLDVLEAEERWLAAQASRRPRSRAELAPLIDRTVLEEALRPAG